MKRMSIVIQSRQLTFLLIAALGLLFGCATYEGNLAGSSLAAAAGTGPNATPQGVALTQIASGAFGAAAQRQANLEVAKARATQVNINANPNLVPGPSGTLHPADGCQWGNPDDPNDLQVVPRMESAQGNAGGKRRVDVTSQLGGLKKFFDEASTAGLSVCLWMDTDRDGNVDPQHDNFYACNDFKEGDVILFVRKTPAHSTLLIRVRDGGKTLLTGDALTAQEGDSLSVGSIPTGLIKREYNNLSGSHTISLELVNGAGSTVFARKRVTVTF